MLTAFAHQSDTTQFILDNPRVLVTSDPGTGKTRSVLDAYAQRCEKRMLVLAPLSILEASWADDIKKFQPHLTYEIAYAKNREKAFASDAKIILINHDGIKWILENDKKNNILKDFDTLCIDEFTAFKNRTSQRSKACKKVAQNFDYRIAMSGTPNSNTILDLWHPTLIVDDGERLGKNFFNFRFEVCQSTFNGFAQIWKDKPDAEERTAAQLIDINIRHELETCLDMPEQSYTNRLVTLPPKIMKQYKAFADESVLHTSEATISAIHAGSRVKKLLQLCTGAVYDENGDAKGIHNERYELVMELVEERKHSLVAFNWKHEVKALSELATKKGITHAVINGDTPVKKRKEIVDAMQAGELQVVFCHPQSAGHGLTLTKATTVIWASPTYNAEHYTQFNRRIYRAGQTKKTEVIHIAANGTFETDVYEKLQVKTARMEELLTLLKNLNDIRSQAA